MTALYQERSTLEFDIQRLTRQLEKLLSMRTSKCSFGAAIGNFGMSELNELTTRVTNIIQTGPGDVGLGAQHGARMVESVRAGGSRGNSRIIGERLIQGGNVTTSQYASGGQVIQEGHFRREVVQGGVQQVRSGSVQGGQIRGVGQVRSGSVQDGRIIGERIIR